MQEITLQQLLEAGCHFGHKSERWHPKASEFIYTEKDGIHIIDLAKTKIGLEKASEFIQNLVADGGEVVFVSTKRQAKGVVKELVLKVGAPFFVERWVGGFLTNWEEIKKNVEKANKMMVDQAGGAWKKFPKHEQVKLARHLSRLLMYYEGVLNIKSVPQAVCIVDVKKEIAAVREAKRVGLPIVGIVDTNSNPQGIDYVIPANDDAVGSVKLLVETLTNAYAQGKKLQEAAVKEVPAKPKDKAKPDDKESKPESTAEPKPAEKKEPKKESKKEPKSTKSTK